MSAPPPLYAKLSNDGPFDRLWNIYEGPLRIAIVEENKQPAAHSQVHPFQIVRGEVPHAEAVRVIEAAKQSQQKRLLKGGIE